MVGRTKTQRPGLTTNLTTKPDEKGRSVGFGVEKPCSVRDAGALWRSLWKPDPLAARQVLSR